MFPFSSLKNMVTKQSITYSVVCFPSLTLLVMEKIMAKTSFRSVDLDFCERKENELCQNINPFFRCVVKDFKEVIGKHFQL